MDSRPHAAKCVLVMDDDEMVRFVAGETLKRYGFEVEFATDGSEAVQLYIKRHRGGAPFAAVILDLNIPGGMGGQETMEKLLQVDPAAKGYVSSGRPDDPVMVNFREFGFSGTIEKPYFYLNKDLMQDFSKALLEME